MIKYQPVAEYLAGRSETEVPMTFAEIEGASVRDFHRLADRGPYPE